MASSKSKDPWQEIGQRTKRLLKLFNGRAPKLVMVLGSGWGPVLEALNPKMHLNFEELAPDWKFKAAPGHALKLWRCDFKGNDILVFQGRVHPYQIDLSKPQAYAPVVFPAICAKVFGAKLLLTNAVGGLRKDLNPGDLILATDFIPLVTPGPVQGGAYFAPMENPADPGLISSMTRAAKSSKITLKKGVLGWTLGPQFESVAQIRAYKTLGCDAIGMSTVPEWITARVGLPFMNGESPGQKSVPTIVLSAVSNKAAGLGAQNVSAQEVLDTLSATMPKLQKLIPNFVELSLGV